MSWSKCLWSTAQPWELRGSSWTLTSGRHWRHQRNWGEFSFQQLGIFSCMSASSTLFGPWLIWGYRILWCCTILEVFHKNKEMVYILTFESAHQTVQIQRIWCSYKAVQCQLWCIQTCTSGWAKLEFPGCCLLIGDKVQNPEDDVWQLTLQLKDVVVCSCCRWKTVLPLFPTFTVMLLGQLLLILAFQKIILVSTEIQYKGTSYEKGDFLVAKKSVHIISKSNATFSLPYNIDRHIC